MGKKDQRIIIHFDYDCFYASVFEAENPALKSLPLAVQQKQIIVTCNYEARRRGLHKLQLVTTAKAVCPDVVIVLGEELGRFRDASKVLYNFLESFTWSGKVERLGFDEVFMDVSDVVDYNQALLNPNNLENSFFQLNPNDPTNGFPFDATRISGHCYPSLSDSSTALQAYPLAPGASNGDPPDLYVRLILGSHFASHLRLNLEEQKGYTSTVGISTNKLLSKLVGNLNKPKGQTTLLPPYRISSGKDHAESNVTKFIDSHDIGKIPGIGFKMSQKIRDHVLSRPADFDQGLVYGGTKESVSVGDARLLSGMGPSLLEQILGGPGAEKGIGGRIWALINGSDETEVKDARKVPTQISIEDSYIKLDTIQQVIKELQILATSLVKRMHKDLLEVDGDSSESMTRWIAHPRTIRLSTRPRPPANSDSTRTRTFNRISRSSPLPNFVFNLKEGIDSIVEKLVRETLLPMFRKLHPQKSGWNLSLMNIGVTNMVVAAGEGAGRDISQMFKRQEDILKEWKLEDRDTPPDLPFQKSSGSDQANTVESTTGFLTGSEDIVPSQSSVDELGLCEDDEDDVEDHETCNECGAIMPSYAMVAHERFHNLGD